jgi:uncharacterized protein (TIGR02145 family)
MNYLTDIAEEHFTWCFTKPSGVVLGLLYNRFVVSHGVSIAPSGWHIPTMAEYETLLTTIGGSGSLEKLRCTGTDYWLYNTGTDDYGFKCRGSGLRQPDGQYDEVKIGFHAWTSDLWVSSVDFPFSGYDDRYGLAIRLIKDDAIDPGTLVDLDGNVYNTVLIGSQVWIAENLAVTCYSDSEAIAEVTNNTDWAQLTTGGLCVYNNDWRNGVS